MNTYKHLFAFIPCLFIVGNVFGQKYVDLARFSYGTTSLNTFEDSDSSTRIKELGLEITIPIVINPSDAILAGFVYERIQTSLFESDDAKTVSTVGLRAGLSKKHSDKWSGTYVVIPKLASDFDRVGGGDFQFGAIALLKYGSHPNKNYKIGVYYNSELSGPFVVPLLGLYYLSANEKIEANVTLPFLVDVNYKVHRFTQVGMNFNGQVRSYHITEVSSINEPGYVAKITNELYGYLKFHLTNTISVQTRFGHSLGRSFRVYDDNDKIAFGTVLTKVGDDRQQLNTDFSDGFIYQATMLYRFITE